MVRGREENLGQGHLCVTEAGKLRASLVAQLVKNPPAIQETPVPFLGQEVPLEKGQAPHSSFPGLPQWLRW